MNNQHLEFEDRIGDKKFITQFYDGISCDKLAYKVGGEILSKGFFLVTTPNVQNNPKKLDDLLLKKSFIGEEIISGLSLIQRPICFRKGSQYGLLEEESSNSITNLGYLFFTEYDNFDRCKLIEEEIWNERPILQNGIYRLNSKIVGYSLDFSERDLVKLDLD